MKEITLVILAAGMGSRYGGLKQMDQLGPSGETVMDYSVFDAIRAGFDRVVFVIRHDFEEEFKKNIVSRYQDKIKVELAFQELSDLPGNYQKPEDRVKPWGTGHAVYAARNLLTTPFAVINADDFYGADCYRQLADFLRNIPDDEDIISGCIVSFAIANTLSENGSVSRGICAVENGKLKEVVENTQIYRESNGRIVSKQPDGSLVELTGNEPGSMNAWGFSAKLVKKLELLLCGFLENNSQNHKSEFYLPGIVDNLLRTGEADITMLYSRDSWFGVTYREDRPKVVEALQKLVSQKHYPDKLF